MEKIITSIIENKEVDNLFMIMLRILKKEN